MKRRTDPGVLELIRDLGSSLLVVLRAEVAALRDDLGRSGKSAAVAVGLLGVGAFVVFWSLAALLAGSVALLTRWLPVWAAAGVTGSALLCCGAGVVWIGWRKLQAALTQPAIQVRARVDDHVDWWQERLLGGPPAIEAGDDEPADRG